MLIFETERLIVREFISADMDYFFMINSNEMVMRFIRKALTKKESDDFFKANLLLYKEHPKLGRWCVLEKKHNRFIGSFVLIHLPFEDEKTAIQLGYALLPEAWGKGYATELTKAGIEYFFTNNFSSELHAITAMQNIASQKVLLKCGFVANGTKKDKEETVQRYILKRKMLHKE